MEHTAVKQGTEQAAPPAVPAKEKKEKPAFQTPKKKRKWVKRLIVIVVAVAIMALVLTRCMGGGSPAALSGSYIPAQAVRQDMVVSVSGTGTIEPIRSYKVTTLIKGEILEAPFEEGATVEEGALLFRIDSKDLENSIQQSELSLQSAQNSLNALLKNQADSQKNGTVKAPAAGVVTKLYVDPGDIVSAGAVIADILDRDNMKLTVPFHAGDAAAFYEGQQAEITVDGSIETIYGVVDSIAATDGVGAGGTLIRDVTIQVVNPGALTDASYGTAIIAGASCAQSKAFEYASSKQVVAKTSGELKTLSVKEGDRVTKDQVLGRFDETDMDSQIANARIQVENAELVLKNARDKLEDYSITSTIGGTVIEKNVDVGDNIDGTNTTSGSVSYPAVIYDLSALTFDINVDELDISRIQVGQLVEITADALDGKTFTGKVDKVNINGSTQNGVTTYPVTVQVDSPEELLPGMNVSAKIIVEDAGQVLCIPVEAVGRGNTVLVAAPGAVDDKGNVVNPLLLEEREVTLGRNDSAFIEVLSGLEEGETIYIQNTSSNFMNMMYGG